MPEFIEELEQQLDFHRLQAARLETTIETLKQMSGSAGATRSRASAAPPAPTPTKKVAEKGPIVLTEWVIANLHPTKPRNVADLAAKLASEQHISRAKAQESVRNTVKHLRRQGKAKHNAKGGGYLLVAS